jgi:hypothetical protein
VIRDAGSGRLQGELEVPVARLWWPYLMDPEPGYMYTLQVLWAFNLKYINSLPPQLIAMLTCAIDCPVFYVLLLLKMPT